jgi:hypothetical protein
MKVRKIPLCEEREQKRKDRELSKSLLTVVGNIAQVRNQREIIIPYYNSVLIFQGGYVIGNSYQDVKRKIEEQGLLMAAAPHAFTLFKYLIDGRDQSLRNDYFCSILHGETEQQRASAFDGKAICFDTILKGNEFNQEVVNNPGTKIEDNRGRIGYHEERIQQVLGLFEGSQALDKLKKANEFGPLWIYSYNLMTSQPEHELDGQDGDFLLLHSHAENRWAKLDLRFANGHEYISKGCNSYYALAMLDPTKNKKYFKAAYRSIVNLLQNEKEKQSRALTSEIKRAEKRLRQLNPTK